MKKTIEEINNMRPLEREKAQIECLKETIIVEDTPLSVRQMAVLLKRNGFINGCSEKTIYRRILPELEKHDIVKCSGTKYGYSARYSEKTISRKQILWCVNTISELVRTEPLKTQKLVGNFLSYQLDLLNKSEDEVFTYRIPYTSYLRRKR